MKIKKMSAKVLVNALSITKKNWKRSKNQLQLPLTSLRTYDVTHSRFVMILEF